MTEPNQQQTNPPNPQQPHAATQPDSAQQQQARPPVVVQAADHSGTNERLNALEQTLSGLPERIVNSFREATQPAQPPVNQGGNQGQQPGTNQNPSASAPAPPAGVEQQATGGTGARRGSRFAEWWFRK